MFKDNNMASEIPTAFNPLSEGRVSADHGRSGRSVGSPDLPSAASAVLPTRTGERSLFDRFKRKPSGGSSVAPAPLNLRSRADDESAEHREDYNYVPEQTQGPVADKAQHRGQEHKVSSKDRQRGKAEKVVLKDLGWKDVYKKYDLEEATQILATDGEGDFEKLPPGKRILVEEGLGIVGFKTEEDIPGAMRKIEKEIIEAAIKSLSEEERKNPEALKRKIAEAKAHADNIITSITERVIVDKREGEPPKKGFDILINPSFSIATFATEFFYKMVTEKKEFHKEHPYLATITDYFVGGNINPVTAFSSVATTIFLGPEIGAVVYGFENFILGIRALAKQAIKEYNDPKKTKENMLLETTSKALLIVAILGWIALNAPDKIPDNFRFGPINIGKSPTEISLVQNLNAYATGNTARKDYLLSCGFTEEDLQSVASRRKELTSDELKPFVSGKFCKTYEEWISGKK